MPFLTGDLTSGGKTGYHKTCGMTGHRRRLIPAPWLFYAISANLPLGGKLKAFGISSFDFSRTSQLKEGDLAKV